MVVAGAGAPPPPPPPHPYQPFLPFVSLSSAALAAAKLPSSCARAPAAAGACPRSRKSPVARSILAVAIAFCAARSSLSCAPALALGARASVEVRGELEVEAATGFVLARRTRNSSRRAALRLFALKTARAMSPRRGIRPMPSPASWSVGKRSARPSDEEKEAGEGLTEHHARLEGGGDPPKSRVLG